MSASTRGSSRSSNPRDVRVDEAAEVLGQAAETGDLQERVQHVPEIVQAQVARCQRQLVAGGVGRVREGDLAHVLVTAKETKVEGFGEGSWATTELHGQRGVPCQRRGHMARRCERSPPTPCRDR